MPQGLATVAKAHPLHRLRRSVSGQHAPHDSWSVFLRAPCCNGEPLAACYAACYFSQISCCSVYVLESSPQKCRSGNTSNVKDQLHTVYATTVNSNKYKCKKSAVIYTVNGNGSKNPNNIALISMLLWLTLPFYDFVVFDLSPLSVCYML